MDFTQLGPSEDLMLGWINCTALAFFSNKCHQLYKGGGGLFRPQLKDITKEISHSITCTEIGFALMLSSTFITNSVGQIVASRR